MVRAVFALFACMAVTSYCVKSALNLLINPCPILISNGLTVCRGVEYGSKERLGAFCLR